MIGQFSVYAGLKRKKCATEREDDAGKNVFFFCLKVFFSRLSKVITFG